VEWISIGMIEKSRGALFFMQEDEFSVVEKKYM
jgi:hypothetical protein